MQNGIGSMAYLAASALFILSLRGLSHPSTARRGNQYGVAGMAIAIVTTLCLSGGAALPVVAVLMVIGVAGGAFLARRVEMTQMPQLVAALHSFVGLAAVLVAYASYLSPGAHEAAELGGAGQTIHNVEIYLGVFIGAVTFTGSIVAFLKLQGTVGGKPLVLPMRHTLNLVAVFACVALGYLFLTAPSAAEGARPLLIMTVIAALLGIHLVMAIGGADMPVVVSMLNSYSGWAAAATGFMLSNDLLIVTGALVGSSGAILSYIMCRAMNRKFVSVIFGGFGTVTTTAAAIEGEVVAVTVDEVGSLLRDASEVIIVPGYGMAVAQAQSTISAITRKLRDKGVKVRFGIHPVAGRLPGHMNVLLAEAKVPYDIVQRRLRQHRRRAGDRRQRHRESGRAGRCGQPDCRHAGARSVEGQYGDRVEAQHGERICRRRQPAFLQGEHAHAVRRCEEQRRRAACAAERVVHLS
jgi:NAD(P) transhydrogenase subunit beta